MKECETCVYGRYARIPASVPAESKLAIVAEAPGAAEIARGRPFVGPSGQLLKQALSAAGIPLEGAFITNALLCRPPKGKPIKREAIDRCRPRLLEELDRVKPSLVLALGNTAVHSLTGNYSLKITTEQGRVLEETLLGKGVMVVPAFHPAKILRTPGDFKTFRTALIYAGQLLQGGQVLKPGETKYQLATTKKHVEQICKFFETLEHHPGRDYAVVSADIETTGLDYHVDRMLVLGISYAKNKALVLTGEALLNSHALFQLPNIRWVWHNGKFDIGFLRKAGIRASVDHDTMLAHYSLNETKGTHDLEQLSAQLIGAQPYKEEANKHARTKKGLAGAPADVVYRRVAMDADYTLQIFEKLIGKVEEDPNCRKLYYNTLLPASELLQHVESYGMPINLEVLDELEVEFSEKAAKLEEGLCRMVEGLWDPERYVEDTGSASVPGRFNPRSTKQLAWLLYDCIGVVPVAKKGRSTDQEVLDELSEGYPKLKVFIDRLKELRVVQKDLSTYVRGLQKRAVGSRVHSTFLIHGTVTGRLSSRNPNLQNITKKRSDVRRVFQAPEGKVFMEADYKGAELRVLAHLSGDEFLRAVFQQGRDLHDEVAIHFFGQNFTHEQRMQAKTVNFGIPYGRSEYSLSDQFKITVDEARQLIQSWFERAPQAAQFLFSCAERAARGEVLITWFGRQRRFGLITGDNLKDIQNEARNFPISSVSSDLTLTSAMRLEGLLAPHGIKILNLVHDSILLEVPDDEELIKIAAKTIREVMFQVPKETIESAIPFEVEIAVGRTWDKMEEIE